MTIINTKTFKIITIIACVFIIYIYLSSMINHFTRIHLENNINLIITSFGGSIFYNLTVIGFSISVLLQIFIDIKNKFNKKFKVLFLAVLVLGLTVSLSVLWILYIGVKDIFEHPTDTYMRLVTYLATFIPLIIIMCCIILYCIYSLKNNIKHRKFMKIISLAGICLFFIINLLPMFIFSDSLPKINLIIVYLIKFLLLCIAYFILFLYGFRKKEVLENKTEYVLEENELNSSI